MKPIPVNIPKLDGNEAKYVLEAVETGWISSEGPFVKEFESKFAERHGRKHGIAVSSGTAALQCAVDALELEPGDEVIVPTFTIIACVTAVLRSGATPVLVDCDPQTFNATPDQITYQNASVKARAQAGVRAQDAQTRRDNGGGALGDLLVPWGAEG